MDVLDNIVSDTIYVIKLKKTRKMREAKPYSRPVGNTAPSRAPLKELNGSGLERTANQMMKPCAKLPGVLGDVLSDANYAFNVKKARQLRKGTPYSRPVSPTAPSRTLLKELDELKLQFEVIDDKQLLDIRTEGISPEGISPEGISPERISPEVDHVDKDDFLLYTNLQSELTKHQAKYANITKDASLKQFRFDCAKAVNLPINAISQQAGQHLQDILDKLVNFLRGNVIDVPPRRLEATQHPGGIEYCADLLARKLVRQGEDVVSSQPEAAFAIAAVIHALWSEFPFLGRLILAHFYKVCPYLVPYYPPQQEGQSVQDYYKALGYEYIDGTVEKQDQFLKRMSGVVRLYAAVIVSIPRVRQQEPHPFGLQNGWTCLAAIVNLTPRPEITATVLLNFLEVAGHRLLNAYGKQFIKLLDLVCTEYMTAIRKVTPDGSDGLVVRLDGFLQKTMKRREVAPPDGQLPSGFG